MKGNQLAQFRILNLFIQSFYGYERHYILHIFVDLSRNLFQKCKLHFYLSQVERVEGREKFDVAIIGGGISGLYCALNLMNDPRTADRGIKNIVLLESSDRFGGRFDSDSAKANFRFAYNDRKSGEKSSMPLLSQLLKDLGMQEDIVKDAASAAENTVTYFGGHHVTDLDVKLNPTVWKDLFNLSENEEIRALDDVDDVILMKLLDHNREKLEDKYQQCQDPDFWTFFRNELTWPIGSQEIPLKDLPVSTLLAAMNFSPGFGSLVEKRASSKDVGSYLQHQMTVKMLTSERYQLKNGWPSIINKIEKQLLDLDGSNGIKINLRRNCRVNSLLFVKDTDEPINVDLADPGDSTGNSMISANHVVIAVPPPVAEKISLGLGDAENADPECDAIRKMCSNVTGEEMTFIDLYFKSDWWNKADQKMTGSSYSDLPSSLIQPFYSTCVKNACGGCENCSEDPSPVGLTITSGNRNTQFWSSLQRIGNPYNLCAIKDPNLTPTSEAVVDVALEQLKVIFRCSNPPRPVMATYRTLNMDSKYGCYSYFWNVGVNTSDIECANPIPGRKLFFCHDAWSDFQGWAEGSLRSTKNVLEKMLAKQ